jgi:flagellar biosynthetic protein FliO
VSDGAEEARPGGYLSQYTDDSDLPSFDTGPSVISALSGLLIVLALIAGAVVVVRKLLGSRFPAARRPGGIRVLASRPVAPRQSLLLVEVEGLVWLVGQGPEGLRAIDRIEEPRALERLDDRYEFLETPFQSELRRTFDLEGAPGEAPPEAGETASDEPTREQRLAALRRRGKPADGA